MVHSGSRPEETSMRAGDAKNPRSINNYPRKTTSIYIPVYMLYIYITYNCRTLPNQDKLVELKGETTKIKWDVIGKEDPAKDGEMP